MILKRVSRNRQRGGHRFEGGDVANENEETGCLTVQIGSGGRGNSFGPATGNPEGENFTVWNDPGGGLQRKRAGQVSYVAKEAAPVFGAGRTMEGEAMWKPRELLAVTVPGQTPAGMTPSDWLLAVD